MYILYVNVKKYAFKIKLFDHIGFNLRGPKMDCGQLVATMVLITINLIIAMLK